MTDTASTRILHSSPELPTGYELGNYTIVHKLGRGGFGITYLARENVSGRSVVIKENFWQECSMRQTGGFTIVPSGEEGRDKYEWALTRFLDEARLLTHLSHPCIVQVLTVFRALGTAYYVMPLVEGSELNQAAPSPEKINEAWLRPVLEQLLGALDYLHGQGLLHRDIKPSNILLRADDRPLLIDFGTAREKDSPHTLTLVGTPGYSPPEQLTPHGKNGPWTDLYSLGATCYHLITGEVPRDAVSRLEEDELRPLTGRAELRGSFSYEFLAAIDKAMSVAGSDRWQTAREWINNLSMAQRPEGTRQNNVFPIVGGCIGAIIGAIMGAVEGDAEVILGVIGGILGVVFGFTFIETNVSKRIGAISGGIIGAIVGAVIGATGAENALFLGTIAGFFALPIGGFIGRVIGKWLGVWIQIARQGGGRRPATEQEFSISALDGVVVVGIIGAIMGAILGGNIEGVGAVSGASLLGVVGCFAGGFYAHFLHLAKNESERTGAIIGGIIVALIGGVIAAVNMPEGVEISLNLIISIIGGFVGLCCGGLLGPTVVRFFAKK